MKRARNSLAFMLAVFLCLTACSPRELGIDNETLGLFGVQLQQAAERRDVKAIADIYAESAIINIQLADGTYPFSGTMNRAEYTTKLAELLKNASGYQLDWANPEITIAEDKKSARATALRKETFVLPEGTKEFHVKETMEMVLAQQRIVVIRQTFSSAP